MTLVKFSNQGTGNVLTPFISDVLESLLNTDPFVSDRLTSRVPAVNIAETANEYHIELAAPGLKKEDFKINLEKNVLSISAETESEKESEDKRYNRKEYSYNSFVRTFTMPDSADYSNIQAEYADGILKINVAKKEEAKMQSREIAIR